MVLNYIWIAFFVIAFVVALLKLIVTGDTEVFKTIIDATFSSSKMAVMDISLPLVGVMTLWLGLMNIGEKAGAINFLSRIVGPFFNKLFPEIPKDHPANGQIMMNFSANMLGLDNAATPLGLKAMNGMQELNPNKDTASNAQIMFLVLNTSGLTIIPVTILAQRAILGAADPSDVFIPILIATYFSTITGLIAVSIWQKINLFNRIVMTWLLCISAAIGSIIWYFSTLEQEQIATISKVSANVILLTIIVSFILGALRKKANVYDTFIEGAKSGFETAIKVIPYLVAMLVGVAVFRASGAMDYLVNGIAYFFSVLNMNTDFVGALPTALMKPLSGSGAKAMMIEAMQTHGPDSFVGRLSCVFQGAADTTFYIVALYFGSVGIKKTRYAVTAGLIADLAGVIAAIYISYLFFH
ncbi:MAG: nucleoside recognition domain-containing protein [Bacteroidia bacterium]|jgi:spore maturation protein SpmA|nr:nucleoside recognition domain-containing protein [Bacteroidia bacterium]